MFDPFSGYFSTALEWMLVRQYGWCVVSNVSEECFEHVFLQFVEVFAMKIGKQYSDITRLP